MKLGIINSAFEQAGVDTKTKLEHITKIGFDTMNIIHEPMTIEQTEINLIKDTCNKHNLPIASVVVVSFGLVDFNDPVRHFHRERIKKTVDLVKEFGANNVLLVMGEYVWQKEVIPPQAQWDWGVEHVKEIGEYAGN